MIKKIFVKDYVLKIVSLLIAILVWLYVIYIVDPEIEVTIDDVPVTYIENSLPDDLILIDESVDSVDIKVSGSRSEVMSLKNSNISAECTLSSISKAGSYENIKITASSSNNRVEIVDCSEEYATVKIDKAAGKQFTIEPEFDGDMPKGYIVYGKPYLSIDTVTVEGAKTYIDDIKGAYIKINCDNLTDDKSAEYDIFLKDKSGNVIDKGHAAYKFIEMSDKTVTAAVLVGKTRTVPIKITDAEDYSHAVSVTPSEVEIYSSDESIDEIYTESIKNKKEDKDGNITLELNIPDTVTVVNGIASVKVKVGSD